MKAPRPDRTGSPEDVQTEGCPSSASPIAVIDGDRYIDARAARSPLSGHYGLVRLPGPRVLVSSGGPGHSRLIAHSQSRQAIPPRSSPGILLGEQVGRERRSPSAQTWAPVTGPGAQDKRPQGEPWTLRISTRWAPQPKLAPTLELRWAPQAWAGDPLIADREDDVVAGLRRRPGWSAATSPDEAPARRRRCGRGRPWR